MLSIYVNGKKVLDYEKNARKPGGGVSTGHEVG